MEVTYFNPETGDYYIFQPGQTPPPTWKKLEPLPFHPNWDIISKGGCTLYEPGKEPKLFADPHTGKAEWVKWPYTGIKENAKQLTQLLFPPGDTINERDYFDPVTGQSYTFPKGQNPPAGWKKILPFPPYPGGDFALYEPGKEPRLYVDPVTGKTVWIQWPYIAVPEGWKRIIPLFTAPPETDIRGHYFNPLTGESYNFKPGETPPPGWKKLKPIAPHPDINIIGHGGCVLYEPGKEPKLFVDPATGETRWVKWPYIAVPEGWQPLSFLQSKPAMTETAGEFFDPATGQSYEFKQGQTPPPGWKKLQPLPPHPDIDIIGHGGCVLYQPGREPKLFVDPETGKAQWVKWPYIAIGTGWVELRFLQSEPPQTQNENEFFDPGTGATYKAGQGDTPPPGWKPLKPVPPHPDWKIISQGGCVYYEPGKEPKLFIDPETGESKWVKWPYIDIAPGWQPISELPASPDKINLALNEDGDTQMLETRDNKTDNKEQTDNIAVDHTINFLLSDPARLITAIITGAYPITEWSIWNPVYNLTKISKYNPAIHISPLNFFYSNREVADLAKLVQIRTSLRQLEGAIVRIRGLLFEALSGGNLRPGFFAADIIEGGYVTQIKSFLSSNTKSIAGQISKAAGKLVTLFKSNPNFFKGSIFNIQSIVPTGTSEGVISTIVNTALKKLKPPMTKLGVQTGVNVVKGIPGAIGKGLKGLGVVGGLLSTYQLVQDVKEGNVVSGIGSTAGTTTFVLESGATLLGSTAMATGAALTGSFAVGYAAGTLINDHVLAEETKSLIGETLIEFVDHGLDDAKEYYGGKAKSVLKWIFGSK